MFWRLQQCRKPQRLAGRRELVTLSFRDKLYDGCMQHGSFAANGCSTKETEHGERVDGRRFFGGEDEKDYPWGQTGGINAGVILLQPDGDVFKQMHKEVTCKNHPCHIAGNGPEQ
ncbi:unnamed protein product, partial [Effrenium voratum]